MPSYHVFDGYRCELFEARSNLEAIEKFISRRGWPGLEPCLEPCDRDKGWSKVPRLSVSPPVPCAGCESTEKPVTDARDCDAWDGDESDYICEDCRNLHPLAQLAACADEED